MSKVIVIGGGLAGLSAAHTILENGGSVLLLDKSAFLGGNSTKATSGINGKFLCFEEKFLVIFAAFFCVFCTRACCASIGSILLFVSLSFLSFFPKQRRAMMMICALSARTLFLSEKRERERYNII